MLPSRFSRYILIELLKVFGVALLSTTVLLLLVGVARQAISEGLGIMPVLKLVPFLLPEAMRYAVPGTILFAACSVYGRLAASGEIGAIKSLGISPMVMIKPKRLTMLMV